MLGLISIFSHLVKLLAAKLVAKVTLVGMLTATDMLQAVLHSVVLV